MIAGAQRKQYQPTAQQTRRGRMMKLNVLRITCFALVLASTVRAQNTPGVNNAELNGNYAFTFNGMTTGGGGASTVFAAVGRLTADGAGNLTDGGTGNKCRGSEEALTTFSVTGC